MVTILAINGSYRDDGVTDQAVSLMVESLRSGGAQVEVIVLRDYPLEFCLNCRACTQATGEAPGQCVLDDGMNDLVRKIEEADAYIVAAPTNFSSVTAIYKRFMERLVVYGDWPWGVNTPKYRKAKSPRKKAVAISSCAAPGFMGRWIYHSGTQLKLSAKVMGADLVGTLFTGLVSAEQHPALPEKTRRKATALAAKLI